MSLNYLAVFMFLLFLVPVQALSVVIHEVGHFVLFRMQRVTPMWATIGIGAFWFKFRYKGSWINVHKIPLVGEVVVAPGHIKRMGLWGSILMLLAGPVLHGSFGTALYFLGNFTGSETAFGMSLDWLGTFVIIQAAYQFLPVRTTRTRNGQTFEIRSDGFQIRNYWRRRAQFAIKNENW